MVRPVPSLPVSGTDNPPVARMTDDVDVAAGGAGASDWLAKMPG